MTTRSKTRTLPESFIFVFDEILEQPPDGNLRLCCKEMGVLSLPDLLELTKEDMHDWSGVTLPPGELLPVIIKFRVMDIIKIQRLQAWYVHHDDPDAALWNTITKPDYQAWHDTDQAIRVRAALGTTQTVSSSGAKISGGAAGLTNPTKSEISNFQKAIKLNINDYNKFKDDKYWHKWLDQITTIAALHQTSDVLDPTYLPQPGDEATLFHLHNTFMYTMLTECVQTSKGKICVRAHAVDRDAQATLVALTKAYTDNVSVQMSATTLRSELTVMRLDANWKRSCESFLTFWGHKVLDLEDIQGTPVSDEQKREWLTATLQTHKELEAAVRQTLIHETLAATASGGAGAHMSWEPFFDLLVSIAKMTDNTNQKASKQRQTNLADRNPTGGRPPVRPGRGRTGGRNPSGRAPLLPRGSDGKLIPNTTYEGPNQVMKKGFIFTTPDWWKLSDDQRAVMDTFRRERNANAAAARRTAAAATVAPPAIPSQIEISSASVAPSAISVADAEAITLGNTLRDILSKSAARKAAVMKITYSVNDATLTVLDNDYTGSLIDGGANGGMSGADVRLLETTLDTADVTGITNNVVSNLPIGTCAGLVLSTTGPIILIMNQYAHHGVGTTVHSVNQLLNFGVLVDPVPKRFGGKQRIRTSSGHVIPLNIRNGLAYMDMSPPSDVDMDQCVHVLLTSDVPWNPNLLDDEYLVEDVHTDEFDLVPDYGADTVNDYGELLHRSSANETHIDTIAIVESDDTLFEDYVNQCLYEVHRTQYEVHDTQVERKQMDFNRLKPNFGWMPVERIK